MSLIKINILIDIGNTNTKYTFIPEHSGWKLANSYPIYIFDNQSDVSHEIFKCLNNQNININKIYISNVSQQNYSEIIKNQLKKIIDADNIIEYKTQAKFKNLINGYDDYTQLGVDRWLALIATHGLYEDNTTSIVVGCGSASVLDIIHNDKFIGGYIIPGTSYMQQSLLQNTEKISGSYSYSGFDNIEHINIGTNTTDCINNGIIKSQISFIEKSIFSFIKSQDIVKYNCIIYGGHAQQISKFIDLPHTVFNNMVMLGLARVLNG